MRLVSNLVERLILCDAALGLLHAAITVVAQVLLSDIGPLLDVVFLLVELGCVILTLVGDVKTLQHVDKHGFFGFDVRLVSVPDEVHVHFPIAALALVVDDAVERILLLKLVEVLVADLRCYLRKVRGFLLAQGFPVDAVEERVSLDLRDTVAAQPRLRITYQSLQYIC